MSSSGIGVSGRHGQSLRVALVGDYPLNITKVRGGVQAAFVNLVKGLVRIDDLEVHVLTFRQRDWSGPDRIEQNGVTVHLLPLPPRFERLRNYQTYQSTLNQRLAQLQPDLIHAQEAAEGAYVALRSGYPTVITAYGIRSEDRKYYSSWGRRLRGYFDSLVIERYTMRHMRHLITTGHYITDYFAPLMRPDIDVHDVPDAIDEHFFNQTGGTTGQIVLFAGRVTPIKRVLDLVQAFARVVLEIPSAQLHIVGECRTDAAYAESVRQLICTTNLADHVQVLGELQQEAVLREFSECALVALPSSRENAPLVISQAMASGKPVVATHVGSIAGMIGDEGERGLLVNVGDIDELAEAMLRLLQDAAQRVRLGQAGHAFACENYHPDSVARRTHEIYQHVTGAGNGFDV